MAVGRSPADNACKPKLSVTRPTARRISAVTVRRICEPPRGLPDDTGKPLLSYTYRVPYSGDNHSIARLAPLNNELLNPIDNLLTSLQYLLLHRSNSLLQALLDNHRIDGYTVFRGLLLNLEPFSSNAADRSPYSFADLA